ncbi:MAG: hypothetical protein JXQ71_05690 [Verrucomicrobia bacterium]|nr:hypothetical protein [Verrucomicrobiota bacterium]
MAPHPSNNRAAGGGGSPPEPSRKTIQVAIVLMAIAAIGAFLLFRPRPPAASGNQEPPAASSTATPSGDTPPADAGRNWTAPRPPPVPVSVSPAAPPPPAALAPAVSPAPAAEAVSAPGMPLETMREQVAALAKLDLAGGNLSPTQLAAYTQSLQSLMAQGQEAFVGATSQMSPAEIERLANNMRALAPDQSGAFATAAANAALTAAAQSANKEDVGPLFRVLQENGGPETVSQIESLAGKWRYYSTIALANLADNAGVPSLIRMVGDENNPAQGSRNAALQALAQVAWNSPDALAVLQNQAKENTIPFTAWINIASVLGGHEYEIGTMTPDQLPVDQAGGNMKSWHLEFSKEDFYSLPNYSQWTDEQIQQRQDAISNLLQATSDPTVKQLLQQASASLANRGAPATPTPAPAQK